MQTSQIEACIFPRTSGSITRSLMQKTRTCNQAEFDGRLSAAIPRSAEGSCIAVLPQLSRVTRNRPAPSVELASQKHTRIQDPGQRCGRGPHDCVQHAASSSHFGRRECFGQPPQHPPEHQSPVNRVWVIGAGASYILTFFMWWLVAGY